MFSGMTIKNKFTACLLCLLIHFSIMTPAYSDSSIKKPNVSGQFYEANPDRLSASIDAFFISSFLSSNLKIFANFWAIKEIL